MCSLVCNRSAAHRLCQLCMAGCRPCRGTLPLVCPNGKALSNVIHGLCNKETGARGGGRFALLSTCSAVQVKRTRVVCCLLLCMGVWSATQQRAPVFFAAPCCCPALTCLHLSTAPCRQVELRHEARSSLCRRRDGALGHNHALRRPVVQLSYMRCARPHSSSPRAAHLPPPSAHSPVTHIFQSHHRALRWSA